MGEHYIERTLWYDKGEHRITLPQGDLRTLREPLVILGEAGMGKTTLLKWLANTPGFVFCTARELVHNPKPERLLGDAQVLVIDALDEVSVYREGDAVGLVLLRLGELEHPRFILSCRVADWRSSTGANVILEQYKEKPIELHLEQFDDNDATAYLNQRIGSEAAADVVEHFTIRGLRGFLGNPQTLYLVSKIAGEKDLPATKDELFERAIGVLRVEHNGAKSANELPSQTVLDVAGAAFAGLILSGNEAITRKPSVESVDGDVSLTELCRLADRNLLDAVLGTRLLRACGPDRFSYWHRSIGEYLAARWLSKQANTSRKRRRLLTLFHKSGLVPSSLRGVHAWLARDPALAPAVIAADPMGVIEYGDGDDLTVEQAHCMLSALSALATTNPRFREWEPLSARGIAHPRLIQHLRELINNPDTPVRLRQFVLEAIKGSRATAELSNDFCALMLDPQAVFINRSAAGKALIELRRDQDWPKNMRCLHALGDELSVRLAIELMDKIGYEQFDDKLIVDLVMSFISHRNRIGGVLIGIELHLPDNRLDGILDHFVAAAGTAARQDDSEDDDELKQFVYALVSRRVASTTTDAKQLWSWLQLCPSRSRYGYRRSDALDSLVRQDHTLRREVQQLVLLEQAGAGSVWSQAWELRSRCEGLAPTPEDVVALLGLLDPSDYLNERWRDLTRLTYHDHESGGPVREAARPFARNQPDLLAWLESLAAPTDWQLEQATYDAEYQKQQADRQAEQREYLASQIDGIREGSSTTIVDLAKRYLGLFRDVKNTEIPAHERISAWLGHDLAEAAKSGFESFLTAPSFRPSAEEIVASIAQGRYWPAACVVVTALAERHRQGSGFADLDDERLLAGLFELRRSQVDKQAGIDGLKEAIEAVVRERGLWSDAMRRYYEPQLQARYAQADVHRLMRADKDSGLAADLAAEWLVRFPEVPSAVEDELIERLLVSGRHGVLRSFGATKLTTADDNRRRGWDAVGLITDFEVTAARIDATPIDAALLWHLRDLIGGRKREDGIALTGTQLEWLISRFRELWPVAPYPKDGWSGDRNPWDASEHITYLIRRLGNDASDLASAALVRLAEATTDGYTELIQAVTAEQRRIRVESSYAPPTLDAIVSIVQDDLPVSVDDLQGFLVEELGVAEAKIRSDDVDSWRGFFDDKMMPHKEERCRDHLISLLRQGATGIMFTPEAHFADDKEADIACSVGMLRMPIEVKGQWHPELWRAADAQLARLYAQDCRAGGRGIYLVLWFGDQVAKNKRLRRPGRGAHLPRTPEQLRKMLTSSSLAAQDGRIKVVVLDLSRT
jgi:hypothetical protein